MAFSNRRFISSPIIVGLLLVVPAGCGGKSFSVVSVSGIVTLDGQPLPEARVAFEPIAAPGELLAGPGSYGKTDAEGRYSLLTIDNQDGAVVGPHRVTISTSMTPPRGSSEMIEVTNEKVPPRYRDGSEMLQFTVPAAGTNEADFALTR